MKLLSGWKHKPAVAKRLGSCEAPRPLGRIARGIGGAEKELGAVLQEVV